MKIRWAWNARYQGEKWIRLEHVWQKRQWSAQVYKFFVGVWY